MFRRKFIVVKFGDKYAVREKYLLPPMRSYYDLYDKDWTWHAMEYVIKYCLTDDIEVAKDLAKRLADKLNIKKPKKIREEKTGLEF
jgi:uncharacterized protein YutE (UPF0331/DUF86 family)